jgi:hypothetical protein
MIILWISRHEPLPTQRDELARLFGPHELQTDVNSFREASDIARTIRETGAHEVVCVAPLSVLQKLLEFGIRPLTARMERCQPEHAEVVMPGRRGLRYLKFRGFRRLTSIEMAYEEITPCRARTL